MLTLVTGTVVTGEGVAGSIIEVRDADGTLLGTATVDAQGNYTVMLDTPQVDGEALAVTQVDGAGNVSDPTPIVAPDLTAPEAPRNFLVFFDWDKADLTADARAIINAAAKASTSMKVTRIETTGHADRSGTDAYNLRLSKRRAEAVKAELNRLGIPAGEIVVRWKGEREPLVATPDGVREPQNRRVEIILNQ